MVNSNKPATGPRPRVVLRDIARAAGVSVMTVSRALRHGEHVSPVLRQRIARLAKRLGYEPDPMLASLVVYRHGLRPRAEHSVVAYLTTDATRDGYTRLAVTGQVFLGAQKRGRELGFSVEPVWLPDLIKRGRDATSVLLTRGIRGLLLARVPKVGVTIPIDWEKFCCVAVGYSLITPSFHYVASHHFQDMILAFDATVARGYRRPMLVMSEESDRRTLHQFHGAFLHKQRSLPAADRLPVLWVSGEDPVEDLRHYLGQHQPDALIAPWPGLLRTVHRLGIHPPRRLGFVDLNLESASARNTGVFQDFPRIGRAAMDRLNMQLHLGERGVPDVPEGTTVNGQWVAGQTLR